MDKVKGDKKIDEEALNSLEDIFLKNGGKRSIKKWCNTYGYDEEVAHELLKEIKYEKKKGHYWWTQWQIIRRHPSYINFCDTRIFDNDKKLLTAAESFLECLTIKKRFGLKEIYHYSIDFSEKECFDNFEIFSNRETVVRIWPEADNDTKGPQSFIFQELPNYGNFIFLGINIDENVKLKDIITEVHRTITAARAVRGIRPFSRKGVSSRPINPQIFKVWDLHKEGKNPIEIIKEVWPDEFKKEHRSSDVYKKEEFNRRVKELKSQGNKDPFEKVRQEIYGDDEWNGSTASGMIKLFMRVRDMLKRMEELIQ
jgi:hypothetical protein